MEQDIVYREAELVSTSADAAQKVIEGYAAIYDIPYTISLGSVEKLEMIRRGAFSKSFQRIKDKSQRPIDILWAHQKWCPLASTNNDSAVVDDRDLGPWFSAKLGNTMFDDFAYAKISDGVVSTVSFGMAVKKKTQGFVGNKSVDIIEEADLLEISPTPMASNILTSVMVKRAIGLEPDAVVNTAVVEPSKETLHEPTEQEKEATQAEAKAAADEQEKASRIIAARKRYYTLLKSDTYLHTDKQL